MPAPPTHCARAARGRPVGARPGRVRPTQLRPAVHRALRDVVLVDDLAAAAELVADNPELRAVTPDGDVVGAYAAAGGSAKAAQLHRGAGGRRGGPRRTGSTAERTGAELREQLVDARAEVAAAKEAVQHAAAAQAGGGEPPQRRRPPAGRAGRGGPVRQGGDRPARREPVPAEAARERDLAALAELEERLRLAEDTPIDDGTLHRGAGPARGDGAAGPAERDGGPARGAYRRGAGRLDRRPGGLAGPAGHRRARGPGAGGGPAGGAGPGRGDRPGRGRRRPRGADPAGRAPSPAPRSTATRSPANAPPGRPSCQEVRGGGQAARRASWSG